MAAPRRRRAAVGKDPSRVAPRVPGGLGSGPAQVNGLYVHASPPRVVAVNSGAVRQWLRGGDLEKLQQLVLDGHGARLLGEYSPDARVRAFIRWLPGGLNKVEAAHAAAAAGQLAKLESALGAGRASQGGGGGGGAGGRLPLALCKDRAGAGLLHKAVFRGQRPVVDWLLENHPATVQIKDREGRTALHYCGACEDPDAMWQRLLEAGADPAAKDNRGRTADYYLEKAEELRLPTSPPHPAESRGRAMDTGLIVKPSNIRIWIHDRDMGKLQQLLWEGHGARLRNETSKYPIVKRFLDGVPFVMGAIKDVHAAAVNGDVDTFQKRTMEPVPKDILTSKDSNGLTPLHKAAGLGHSEIVEDILERAPHAVSVVDGEGRTALHYAAATDIFNRLVRAGADELAQDHMGRTPEHYKNKPSDLDASLLRVVPDAPRTASNYPPGWDWNVISDPAGRVFNGRRVFENGDSESASSRDNEDVVTPGQQSSASGGSDGGVPDVPGADGGVEDAADGQGGDGGGGAEDEAADVGGSTEAEAEGGEPAASSGNADDAADDAADADGADGVSGDATAEDAGLSEVGEGGSGATGMAGADGEEVGDAQSQDAANDDDAAEDADVNDAAEDEGGEGEEGENEEADVAEQQEDAEQAEETSDAAGQEEAAGEGGTGQSDATTVALGGPGGTPADPGPPQRPDTPPESDRDEGGGGGFRTRPPTPRPQPATALANGGRSEDDEDEEDEGVGEDDDDRDPREPGQMTEAELDAHIARGDLGVLADLVLNGEGDRLLSKNSSNAEVQSFLDHVPTYMSKIRAVHDAARAGNLRSLQAALDRRKFAVARDRRSSSACTPLHLAVLLGQTAVVRYLAGRFPETLAVRDLRGRTPLHYAAVLADNGHYYNLLLNLGANRALKDKSGRTADFYLQHPTTLTHRQLLADIGEPETIADEMFSDKDPLTRAAPRLGTLFGSEDGRYLAAALGEPLLQGLNEIADKKPRDPVGYLANFLYNFTTSEAAAEDEAEPQEITPIVTTGPADPDAVGNDAFANFQRPDSQASDEGPRKSAFNEANRDEFGQSPLHFAAARQHGRGGLLQFMADSDLNPALRDELYRTARDVAGQAALPENVAEIDRWVLSVAARGQTDKLAEMLLAGYDHILDARDGPDVGIVDVAAQRGFNETVAFLESIPAFEERRERVLRAIRVGGPQGAQEVAQLLQAVDSRAKLLATARNSMGRCCLHVAVLCQQEELVAFLAHNFPDTLHVGDNLERTPLHYAMGVDGVESLSKLLIKAGAKRVLKDLKGRQPSYYFMNKSDIQSLQEEEEAQML
ncbi:hypothetical protein ONE63_008560 [Megalurothrips usitatus]|uniref:Uncharacterized protein n=1 Tax=Megalurothrips usitatus TaxID=439358 RepID=A0AAV7XMS7_9NEOP|nr:hypothetical protein ONE63_008560 [Megalurothrips usitatus]